MYVHFHIQRVDFHIGHVLCCFGPFALLQFAFLGIRLVLRKIGGKLGTKVVSDALLSLLSSIAPSS